MESSEQAGVPRRPSSAPSARRASVCRGGAPAVRFAGMALMLLTGSRAGAQDPPRYDPIEQNVEGWTVAVDPRLLGDDAPADSREALVALANHLQRVRYIVPAERLAELQRLKIWIEFDNPKLASMQYHPNRQWLVRNGHDPRLTKHVHIPRAANLLERGMWAKHPYVVLHELAHAYHDQVLGFDHPRVIEVYNQARASGIYERVLPHAGKTGVRHYALTNHMEYFAEATEAYFGVNDFYPFVRAELAEHDPAMFKLLREIWGPVP